MDSITLPPPIGGWNTRDTLTEMPPTDAVIFENAVVRDGKVMRRQGINDFPAQMGGEYFDTWLPRQSSLVQIDFVDSVNGKMPRLSAFVLNETTGNTRLVMFDPTVTSRVPWFIMFEGFDATNNPNPTGAEWDSIRFANRTIFVGAKTGDIPIYYDSVGTFLNTITPLTGLLEDGVPLNKATRGRFFKVESHGSRLFYLEKGTMNIWYMKEPGEYTGEMGYFDVSFIAKKGKEIVELAEWTRAGSDTINTLLVAVTDAGEVLMWKGSDPEEADDWELFGKFYIPRPLGNNCVCQVGSDLFIMTEQGIYNCDAFTSMSNDVKLKSFSDKIRTAMDSMATEYRKKEREGDDPASQLFYSTATKQMIWWWRYADEPGQAIMYDLESETFAKITGLDNIGCMCDFSDRLYVLFPDPTSSGGSNGGKVGYFADGFADFGEAVHMKVQQAYNKLGQENLKKVSDIIVTAVYPSSLAFVTAKFYSDFKYQSLARVNLQVPRVTPGETVYPVSTSVAVPAIPCYFFGFGLEVERITTDTVSQKFEWISTQVLFKAGGL